jgi:hypothetical protein
MPRRRHLIHAGAALLFLAAIVVALLSRGSGTAPSPDPGLANDPLVAPAEARTWKAAADKVAEARGEPVGRAASVTVPPELRHYAQTRRFLAVQVAETAEQDVQLPHDEAELARFVQEQRLVRMNALGDDYLLYGVGSSASSAPLEHWDERTGTRVPLFDNWADYKDAEQPLMAEVEAKKAAAAAKRAELKRTSVKQRTRRRQLLSQARAAEREAAALETRRIRISNWYEDYDRRRLVTGEYRLLRDFAAGFDGKTYDVQQPAQRRLLRARLLSYVRPEARDLILELAKAYHDRFGRLLPVTSLVRDEAYQRHLGRTNPNATTIDSPPHATGLAFDAHYGHMTAAEQDFLMAELARLESEGRVEALRENRNHFHVFVFPDGRRPSETLIAASLREIGPTVAAARTSTRARSQVSRSRMRTAASVKKAPARKAATVKRAPAKKAPAKKKAPVRRTTRRR